MKQGTRGRLAIGLMVGVVVGTFAWAGGANAFFLFLRCRRELNECRADVNTCDEDLGTCQADLTQCQAETQTFPGDGYPNPDTWNVSGHGPALDYTDNGDRTVTDNKTKFVWEEKLKADGSDGGHCDETDQPNRSVHCVNNTYKWSNSGSDADGALWNEFLYTLNNTCAMDALKAPGEATDCSANGDDDCAMANGGPGGLCGFAGHRDWEIANIKKLQSIVDYSERNPAIDPSFPGKTAASGYWSATTFATNSDDAWGVDFNFGFVSGGGKGSAVHARAVRSGSD
jgi:hypothetical protein